MNKIPHSVRQNLAAQRPVGDHPDADQLAALSEQRLSGAEREGVLAHLAACPDCREIVALSAPESIAAQPTFVPARSWWSARSVQWGTAAAAFAIAAIGVALLRPSQPPSESQVAQVAQKTTVAPSPPAPREDETKSADSLSRYAGVRSELSPQRKAQTKPEVRDPGNTPEQASQDAEGVLVGRSAMPAVKGESAPLAKNDVLADKKSKADQYAFSTAPAKQKLQESELGMLSRNVPKERQAADRSNATSTAASQTVEVTAEAAPIMAQTETKPINDSTIAASTGPSAAQVGASGQAAGAAVGLQKTATRRASKQSEAGAVPAPSAAAAFKLNAAAAGTQAAWRISAGRLQHLDPDLGEWDDVDVGTAVRLSVVGSAGNEIWVGGANGTMFYSNDSGASWVPVSTGGWDKNATIVGLTPTARQSVEVYLSNGERWRSADAGASWNKYR